MAYPSVISNITNPNPTDKLNSPSHSAIHTAENTAINEIENYVGLSSLVAGTLSYDIRSSGSDGGGHVQGVNKGGTGFTSYTKGDTLVASSSSVISKLAVGLDGQVLQADSSVAAGVKWGSANSFTNKIANSGSIIGVGGAVVTEQSVFSVTIPGSTLGTSNAVRARLYISNFVKENSANSVLFSTQYGGNTIGSILFGTSSGVPTHTTSTRGVIEIVLIGNNNVALQRSNLLLNLSQDRLDLANTSIFGINAQTGGTSSVASGADKIFGATVRFSDNPANNTLEVNGYTVEKIS